MLNLMLKVIQEAKVQSLYLCKIKLVMRWLLLLEISGRFRPLPRGKPLTPH